jgi:hypothetical protein
MRCRICKQATLPGARLCGPCRAALKRARHGGEADVAGLEDESPERFGVPAAGGVPQDSLPPSQAGPGGRRRWPAVVMIASILGAASYVLPRSHFAPAGTRAVPAVDASRVLAQSQPAVTGALAKASAAETPAAARAAATVEAAPGGQGLVEAAPARNDDLRSGDGRVRHLRKRNAIDLTSRPASQETAAPVASSPGASPAPTAPVVVAEVTHTRWQSMDDAMAACRGGFFDRLLCRQKARIAFCDGYWGRVAQCATAPATDATR